jgi:TPR repeat protein
MYNLGAMMMKGEGGAADRTRAWVWLKMAHKGENPQAAAALSVLEARMTAEEKAQAQSLLSPANG